MEIAPEGLTRPSPPPFQYGGSDSDVVIIKEGYDRYISMITINQKGSHGFGCCG